MALRCFTKCPHGAHQWGTCRGAEEGIWHHCKKLPIHVPKHHQLEPFKPCTSDVTTHLVNNVPWACHIPGKVGIWTRHWRWHAANGPLSGSATSVPAPSRDSIGWQSTGASLRVYRHGNHGEELVVDGFPANHHSIQIPHLYRPGPSTYEAILLGHPEQSTVKIMA